jgi:hypothetical protein
LTQELSHYKSQKREGRKKGEREEERTRRRKREGRLLIKEYMKRSSEMIRIKEI